MVWMRLSRAIALGIMVVTVMIPTTPAAAQWSAWETLGGALATNPAVAAWGPGHLDVFVMGTDRALWHKWFEGGWSDWESLGGSLTSGPAVAAWGPGRVDVFVRGTDNALWHKWYQGGWSGWESLGGALISGPAVAAWGPGRLDVVVIGTDHAVWHKWYQGGWSDWESLGGTAGANPVGGSDSNPGVAAWGPGRLDVFVRGSDSALWHKWYQGGWGGWESLGGPILSGPAAAAWGPGRLDIFAAGTDNALWHKSYQGGWSGWESLGGSLLSDPAVAAWAPGRLDVFAKGNDSSLWHIWVGGGATGPAPATGTLAATAVPNMAGTWYDRGGAWVYQFTQNGNQFTWVRNPPESASGTITVTGGAVIVSANWGTGRGNGRVTVDNNNVATQIQWDNGEVFTRTAGAQPGGGPQPPPASGGGVKLFAQYKLTSNCGANWDGTKPNYWTALVNLQVAPDGTLFATFQQDALRTQLQSGRVDGTTLTMTVQPTGWVSQLVLNGTINGAPFYRITGTLHHSGTDDCNWTMTPNAPG